MLSLLTHPVMSAFMSMFTRYCIAVSHVTIYMLDIAVMFVGLHVCTVALLLLHERCCFRHDVASMSSYACLSPFGILLVCKQIKHIICK